MMVKLEFQLCSTVFKLVANEAHKVFSKPIEQTQDYSSKASNEQSVNFVVTCLLYQTGF